MSDQRTITLYVTETGEIWATGRDLKGGYAVRQEVGEMADLLGHFGNIAPRARVDEHNLADPEDIAGHPFAHIVYDPGTDHTRLILDQFVVNEFGDTVGPFITGVRHLNELEIG